MEWRFFYEQEGEDGENAFTIEAPNFTAAFDIACEERGPEVVDMYYVILNKPVQGTLALSPNGQILNMTLDRSLDEILAGKTSSKPIAVLDEIERGDARIYNRENY